MQEPVSYPNHIHPTAIVEEGAQIGAGTRIWHFSHIMPGASIGERCILGQNVYIDAGVQIGNGVKIQNNVSVYKGVSVADDVFLGPSVVFTNVINPRSAVNRKSDYKKTYVARGATIGANATIVCGTTIGEFAFIGAGAVVTRNVPPYALIVGNPGRQTGWMSEHGERLALPADGSGEASCPTTGRKYVLENGVCRAKPA